MGLSINTSYNTKQALQSNKKNSIREVFMKRKEMLYKQIENINKSKDDDKTKQDKIKGIQAQIDELDKQMIQAQLEEQKKKVEEERKKAEEKTKKNDEEKAERQGTNGVIVSGSMNDLISANHDLSSYKSLKKQRTELIGKMNVAQEEIKSNNGRGSVKYQINEIGKASGSLYGIAQQMSNEADYVKGNVNKASKDGIKQKEILRKAEENEKNKQNDENDEINNSISGNIDNTNIKNINVKSDISDSKDITVNNDNLNTNEGKEVKLKKKIDVKA